MPSWCDKSALPSILRTTLLLNNSDLQLGMHSCHERDIVAIFFFFGKESGTFTVPSLYITGKGSHT